MNGQKVNDVAQKIKRSEFFVNKIIDKYDIIVNCIANTDTYSKDKDSHWKVNCVGLSNIIKLS